MTIWVDGKLLGGNDVPRSKATAPFETIGVIGSVMPLWSRHIARLSNAAERLGLSFDATPEMRAAATEVLLKNGHTDGVLRLSLVPEGDKTQVVLASRKRSPIKTVKLLPTVLERAASLPPADLKAEPRRFYNAVLQQAQDGEADDGIVVGTDGALLETAIGNLWLRIDGTWLTPPLDGRVLPGIAREVLLEQARSSGLAMRESELSLADLHRTEAMAHSNAVYGPRPACLLGESAAVGIVDTELGSLWRDATRG